MVGQPTLRAGIGREAVTGGPPGGPGAVDRPYRRVKSGWESLPEGRERLRGTSGGLGVVGRFTRMVRRPSRRFKSGCEAHPKVREWSGCHPGRLGVVGRPTRRDVSG